MSDVPNLKHVIQAVRDSRAWDFSTADGFWAYGSACVLALHRANADFGELSKSSAQNHRIDPLGRYVAVDAALYKPTGQAVDFIGDSGVGRPNPVAWSVNDPVGKYGPEKWLAPASSPASPPVPPSDSPPGTDPSAALVRIVTQLEADIEGLLALHAEVERQIGMLNEQLAALDELVVKKPLPEYYGRNWAGGVTSRPK